MRKVNESDMKTTTNRIGCLPALTVAPSADVTVTFLVITDNTPELLTHFDHTFIRGRREGCSERSLYGFVMRLKE